MKKEEQLSFLDEPKKRGGARKGSGRKNTHGKTSTMRIPDAYKNAIKALIAHLDDCKGIDSNYRESHSEPVTMRSLHDKQQQVIITVKPL